jgi:acyl-CoA dehydrogenase
LAPSLEREIAGDRPSKANGGPTLAFHSRGTTIAGGQRHCRSTIGLMLGALAFALCLAGILAAAIGRAPLWAWALGVAAITAGAEFGLLAGPVEVPTPGLANLLAWLPALVLSVLSVPRVCRAIVVAPAFRMIRQALSRASDTARQTASSGTVGFEAEFFGGRPNFDKLRALPPITLADDERAFLEGATEELCRIIDDWQIRHERKIPDNVWSFVKARGFLGMRISRQYGGLGLSPQALSLVFGKIASRSPDVFATIMIPNSLGLGELIEAYGTDAQKRHHLPRLANGDDVPCLALTGPTSGSDAAGGMRDIGVIVKGSGNGADSLCIRVSWDKRYIALAPCATMIGLVFHLFDPENLLGQGEDIGITVALVPAHHPGVNIGRWHLPSGAVFPVGPTSGTDVLIPLSWVIGGKRMVGQGWRMMLEGLAGSRAIALPACAAAGIKLMLRLSTAYGLIRRQFGSPIARMEALEEPLARMIEAAYVMEAARAVTAAIIDRGENSVALSALMKYQATERLRRCVNDAMDLQSGRAVCDGPANYLQSAYQILPTAITVEGANIVARALLAFTLGAMRAHPYLQKEIQACADADAYRGISSFEKAFLSHISFSLSIAISALVHNLTAGAWCSAPRSAADTAKWHRQLQRASRSFAFVSDMTLFLVGTALRTRQKLAGRLADALSELYLLACTLKRFEDDAMPADDRRIVAFAASNGLYRFQEAIRGAIDNFPVTWARLVMAAVVFPFGRPYRPASDQLGRAIVGLALEPGPTRDRLTRDIYTSSDQAEPIGLLESTLRQVVAAENANKKIDRAVRRGTVRRFHGVDWIGDAVRQGVISDSEGMLVREVEAITARVIAVDDFDPDVVKPNYMTPGDNIRAAQRV